jgi:hypothetical protein
MNAIYEESVFFLFENRLPTEAELLSFRSLAAKRTRFEPVHNVLKDAASEGIDAAVALVTHPRRRDYTLSPSGTNHSRREEGDLRTQSRTHCLPDCSVSAEMSVQSLSTHNQLYNAH